ncbi:MAG: biliverdin-producing heme oxygenase [Gammaproteobacteria bacterium]|nr:biliverdin-producing heme oxygenase [Gammaproteobacteria bacterium]
MTSADNHGALAALLREATKSAHRALDHHPLLAPLVRRTLTMADYADALAGLHAPQAALEQLLAGFAPVEDFKPRLPDLRADLASLSVLPPPLGATPPCASGVAARIGIMYVIEGSNLGGAAIARVLETSLPVAPRAFFGGAGGAERWRRFWRFADAWHPDPDIAVAAARETFGFFHHHLDSCLG